MNATSVITPSLPGKGYSPYVDFVERNGIDATTVALAPFVIDHRRRTLTVTVFVLDEQGRRVIDPRAGYAKRQLTVPLVSDFKA